MIDCRLVWLAQSVERPPTYVYIFIIQVVLEVQKPILRSPRCRAEVRSPGRTGRLSFTSVRGRSVEEQLVDSGCPTRKTGARIIPSVRVAGNTVYAPMHARAVAFQVITRKLRFVVYYYYYYISWIWFSTYKSTTSLQIAGDLLQTCYVDKPERRQQVYSKSV
jgi:hypothetical protein